jgi:hypothetical protein
VHHLIGIVEEPKCAELPLELRAQLFEHTRQGILDRFRFGEGATDRVLNEKTTVEVVVLMDCRGSEG